MKSTEFRLLKISLLAGGLYFLAIACVHLLGVKIPLLFIYFNVPSNAYQDRIISFLAFGWAVFLFTAAADPQGNRTLVRAVLVAGAGALLGLCLNNLLTDFSALNPAADVRLFWLETVGVFVYWLWLVVVSFRTRE